MRDFGELLPSKRHSTTRDVDHYEKENKTGKESEEKGEKKKDTAGGEKMGK